jgi:phage tail sheath gpL-like
MSIDQLAESRLVGFTPEYKDYSSGAVRFLPMRIAIVGQGNSASSYALTKKQISSAAQAAALYGYGSPIHLASLMLFPRDGDGVGSIPVTVYPLEDDSSAVAAGGNITAAGTQVGTAVYRVKFSNIYVDVVIPDGTTAQDAMVLIRTAILSNLNMPVIPAAPNAGIMTFSAKWAGASGNDIYCEIEGTISGITYTITQATGGLVNPDITSALELIGPVWEVLIVNCLNYTDQDALDVFQSYGETRWQALENKPFISFCGTADNRVTRTVVTNARKDDYINSLQSTPGCRNLPCQIAARTVARIAVTAQSNPPQNYKELLTGLTAGDDSLQEDWVERDLAIKSGSSTTILTNGNIEMNDTMTMYNMEGEEPAYKNYVVDLIKDMNVIYNCGLIFRSPEWKGAPLIPDGQPSINPTSKKPSDAKTALINLAVNLGLESIISDVEFSKKNITAAIDGTNPKRLNWGFPVKRSGNTEIIDGTIYFGFYFGN